MDSGRIDLGALIRKGGIFYNIEGNTPRAVLEDAVGSMPLPASLDRSRLLSAMIEREELMPTAVGRGIALPHPRNPLLTDSADQMVTVCFLGNPIDYKALDREPVFVLFILLSAQARFHLQILSRLSYLCREESFITLLHGKPSTEELLSYISKVEGSWVSG